MSVPFKDELRGSSPVPDVDALVRARARRRRRQARPRGLHAGGSRGGASRRTRPARAHRFRPGSGRRPRPICTPRGTRSGRTRSPRTAPASATLVVTAKQWLRRLARPVAAVTLARQAEFNGAVARLLTGATHGVQSLEAGNEALLRRLDEVERRNLELHARCDELQAEVRGLQARLEPDGHAEKPE